MRSRLKSLYKFLVENRKREFKGWHDAYQEFYNEVQSVKVDLLKGKHLSQSDEEFLKQLIYEKNNGIASRGQSVLSKNNFDEFIKNPDFITALEQLILSPTQDYFEKLELSWTLQGKSNNPVLINRIAAACTIDVSTTVDSGKFNQVFSWLISENIIPEYPAGSNQSWFSKNIFLTNEIKQEFSEELKSGRTDMFYLNQFVWLLYQNYANPFSLKKQVVKYGCPGTGKTYKVLEQTELLFEKWKDEFSPGSLYELSDHKVLIQFHPSFSYEDFIEGLRPELDTNGITQLTLQNGIFKAFCCKAGKWEIDIHNLGIKKFGELTIADIQPFQDKLSGEHWDYIFKIADKTKLLSNVIPPFYFIIDEINRAELSRVFGELMYCLEYRGTEHLVKTQYSNLNNKKTAMIKMSEEYLFFIPNNIYIFGTMNTTDRSVESFDFALRRRFQWEEIKPDADIVKYYMEEYHKTWVQLAENFNELNKSISREQLLGPDFQVGHAYLLNLKYSNELTITEVRNRIWDDFIGPLLQEYLRGSGQESDTILKSCRKAFGA